VVISGALDLNQLRGIRVDPRKRLASQPGLGHNRWHPDLRPALEVDSGEVFVLETIDASDATVTRSSPDTPWDVALIHPLTGPVYIAGAKPDDVLEIEILDVGTGDTGTSSIHPSEGLLGGWIDRQETIVWDLRDGFARSPAIPGVSIPAAPFPGCIGVAPSAAYVAQARRRETALAQLGAPTAVDHEPGAVPASVIDGLRTLPPRENGGNMDVRQLTAGSRLFVRVQVDGGLLSVGDMHFAQGDGELGASAIETSGWVALRCTTHHAPAWTPRNPVLIPPPERDRLRVTTTGHASTDAGVADIASAARAAAWELATWVTAHAHLDFAQASVVLSVAADLRIAQLVNDPYPTVTATLPVDIFDAGTLRPGILNHERRNPDRRGTET
jgi:formamidase